MMAEFLENSTESLLGSSLNQDDQGQAITDLSPDLTLQLPNAKNQDQYQDLFEVDQLTQLQCSNQHFQEGIDDIFKFSETPTNQPLLPITLEMCSAKTTIPSKNVTINEEIKADANNTTHVKDPNPPTSNSVLDNNSSKTKSTTTSTAMQVKDAISEESKDVTNNSLDIVNKTCEVESVGNSNIVNRAEYRLQFIAPDSGLVSVPEHDLLTQVDTLISQPGQTQSAFNFQTSVPDSKESDGTSETHSESNSTNHCSLHGGIPVGKTEPLTAKQQVALWLTRTSAQDLNNEFSMSSLRNLVIPSSISNKSSKKKRVSCVKQTKDDMRRNSSTKSLMDKYTLTKDPGFDYSPIRKCETVLALSDSRQFEQKYDASQIDRQRAENQRIEQNCFKTTKTSLFDRFNLKTELDMHKSLQQEKNVVPLRPVNRLRSQSSLLHCSRCTSVLSVNSRTTSQMSLFLDKKTPRVTSLDDITCKICLIDYARPVLIKLDDCGCLFCKECMNQYITIEVMAGAYDIACPDQDCPAQGVLNQKQMELLTNKELIEKHKTFRLNTEVSLDASRTFCPSAGCDTICHICVGNKSQGVPVSCPSCLKEFCSLCSATWHSGLSCSENGALLVAKANKSGISNTTAEDCGLVWASDEIKKCPMCSVFIERDAGCAQMMCKRCKHVFCWYCLTSLDDDFLLRHYDSGECEGKLGHSRASVVWHRAQVIGIFAGFGILLLIASPLLIVAAPCVLCCKCRNCSKSLELTSDSSFSKITKSSS